MINPKTIEEFEQDTAKLKPQQILVFDEWEDEDSDGGFVWIAYTPDEFCVSYDTFQTKWQYYTPNSKGMGDSLREAIERSIKSFDSSVSWGLLVKNIASFAKVK